MTSTLSTPAARQTFCVVFRMGGTANYRWARTLGMSRDEADMACAETRRMGYAAHVANLALSQSVGLPETFDASGTV